MHVKNFGLLHFHYIYDNQVLLIFKKYVGLNMNL